MNQKRVGPVILQVREHVYSAHALCKQGTPSADLHVRRTAQRGVHWCIKTEGCWCNDSDLLVDPCHVNVQVKSSVLAKIQNLHKMKPPKGNIL